MSALDVFKEEVKNAKDPFVYYRVELQVLNRIVGGIPKDRDTIAKWLSARLKMDDAALVELAEKTYEQMKIDREEIKLGGGEVDSVEPTTDEVIDAISRSYEGGNGFKFVEGHMVYEGRCLKAALKEATNISYPNKTPWPGRPDALKASGLKSKLAERVFVIEDYIDLGTDTASEVQQRIKHVQTPQGPRSAINVVDVVDQPYLRFHVKVLDDFLPPEAWLRIWAILESNGIGADRARGDGVLDLRVFEKITREQCYAEIPKWCGNHIDPAEDAAIAEIRAS